MTSERLSVQMYPLGSSSSCGLRGDGILKKRFSVLCVSVVYRGCVIPVAWRIVGAEEKGSWQPIWIALLL
jgi:hypothetical protein